MTDRPQKEIREFFSFKSSREAQQETSQGTSRSTLEGLDLRAFYMIYSASTKPFCAKAFMQQAWI